MLQASVKGHHGVLWGQLEQRGNRQKEDCQTKVRNYKNIMHELCKKIARSLPCKSTHQTRGLIPSL